MSGSFLDKFLKTAAPRPYAGTLNFFSDGGIRINPPAASSAVVVKDERGQVLEWFNRVLPPLTSMEAEYHGILDALAVAQHLKPRRAYFHLDNQTVVGQVTLVYQVREPKLKRYHQEVLAKLTHLRESGCAQVEFYYIPREFNLLADALASDALLVLPERQRQRIRLFTRPNQDP
jgi:ribonuclease HI